MIHSQGADEQGEPTSVATSTFSPLAAARESARALASAAPWVQYGTLALGLVEAIRNGCLLFTVHAERSPEIRLGFGFGIVASPLAYGIAGLAAGRVLAALAQLVETHVARVEIAAHTAEWCESALTRLTQTLERSGARPGDAVAADGAHERMIALRQAIAEREWAAAEQHIRDFVVAYPDHPHTARLSTELAEGREAAAHDLRTRLDAARAANDPDRVLELREGLALLLSGEPLQTLDHELGQWFLQVIQKRLRAGGMRPEIPALAARVADALDATPSGASLRAALPTLRRSAGLCARCGEPYAGIADACPKCLAHAASAPAAQPAAAPPPANEEEDAVEPTVRDDDPFVRDESE